MDKKDPVEAESEEAREALCRGDQLFERGSYTDARENYLEAMVAEPGLPSPLVEKAKELSRQGLNNEAVEFLGAHLDLRPLDGEAWKLKGVECVLLDLPREAAVCFQRALQIGPEDIDSFLYLGYIEADKFKRYDRAIACYDRALEVRKRDPRIWSLKGLAFHNNQQFKKAISCYNHALKVDPDNSGIWKDKGDALNCLALGKKAVNCYRRALDNSPRDPGLWHILALTLDELGERKEATRAYRKVLELAPDDEAELINHARLALDELDRPEESG